MYDNCRWEFDIDGAYDLLRVRCVGPNGNNLLFKRTGKQNIENQSEEWEVFFWIKDCDEGNEKTAIHMYNAGKRHNSRNVRVEVETFFTGFKLPVRLVKSK